MHSDTIIGIAGAVVLVGVMVGVFAYEYNNADVGDDAEPTDDQLMHDFEDMYPGLAPGDDIDGDGVANYMDDDMDGDGIPNAEDDEIKLSSAIDGTLGIHVPVAAEATPQTHSFEVATGNMHIMIRLSAPAIVSGTTTGALSVSLSTPEGPIPADTAVAGGTVTYSIDVTNGSPGMYTLSIGPSPLPSLATSYDGDLTLHYDGGEPAEPHSH